MFILYTVHTQSAYPKAKNLIKFEFHGEEGIGNGDQRAKQENTQLNIQETLFFLLKWETSGEYLFYYFL